MQNEKTFLVVMKIKTNNDIDIVDVINRIDVQDEVVMIEGEEVDEEEE